MLYRAYRNVRYQHERLYRSQRGIGIYVVPNVPTCLVKVLMSNYSKSPVPVIPAVYTGCMPRYVPYREHPSHFFGFEVISIWVKTLFGLFLTEVGSVTA